MLLRMYLRWAERHRFRTDIIDSQEGEQAGIKSATIEITGRFAYGWLRVERGVHRLVRISPYDGQKRRQTTFALIEVMPEADEDVAIELNWDRHVPILRRWWPARPEDGIGDPADAHPHRDRGLLPERALRHPEP
jgi:protein subunit release factor B